MLCFVLICVDQAREALAFAGSNAVAPNFLFRPLSLTHNSGGDDKVIRPLILSFAANLIDSIDSSVLFCRASIIFIAHIDAGQRVEA